MYSEEQYVNQCMAEIAVLRAFGLPEREVKDYPLGGSFLTPYGIHAVLHGNSGVPQDGQAGDLLVICEVDELGIRIHSVSQLADDGSLKLLIDKPGRVDLPTRMAEILATRLAKEQQGNGNHRGNI
jgi:hypothetical protein